MRERLRDWLLFPKNTAKLASILLLPLLVALGLLISILVRWEQKSLEDIQTAGLADVGRAFYQHIMATRLWSGGHGGIYLEIPARPPAGPAQTDPGVNVLSIMGKSYAKVNPNVITKSVMEIISLRGGYQFHITSLNSFDPANRPDEWEEEALRLFGKGEAEATTIATNPGGARSFRYMAPLALDESCLKCHQRAGYKFADIRGGISITIPMSYSDSLYARQMKRTALSYATIGMIVIAFMMLLVWYFSGRISAGFNIKLQQEDALRRLNEQLSRVTARDRKIIENIRDGMAVIDANGRVEIANPVFLRAAGLGEGDVVGRHVDDFPRDGMAGRIISPYHESGFVPPSGVSVLSARSMFLADPVEIAINDRDFTVSSIFVADEERGGLFCELRILHDSTREKLKAAMEVSAAAAHEIRQPLAILLNIKDLVSDKIGRGECPDEELRVLEEQIARVDDIISRMLSVTAYKTRRYAEDMRIFDLETGGESPVCGDLETGG